MSERTPVDELLEVITGLRGDKIVTLAYEERKFVIDINANGKIGYDPTHEALFRAKLFNAMDSPGSLIVRQFLPIKVERTMTDGRKRWIPKKKIYGVVLVNGSWLPISKAEMRTAYCIDHKTGEYLAPEPDVIFAELEK